MCANWVIGAPETGPPPQPSLGRSIIAPCQTVPANLKQEMPISVLFLSEIEMFETCPPSCQLRGKVECARRTICIRLSQ